MGIRNARQREKKKNIKQSKERGITTFLGLNGVSGHSRHRLLNRLPSGEHLPSMREIKDLIKQGKVDIKKGKGKRKILRFGKHRIVTDRNIKVIITYTPNYGGNNNGK